MKNRSHCRLHTHVSITIRANCPYPSKMRQKLVKSTVLYLLRVHHLPLSGSSMACPLTSRIILGMLASYIFVFMHSCLKIAKSLRSLESLKLLLDYPALLTNCLHFCKFRWFALHWFSFNRISHFREFWNFEFILNRIFPSPIQNFSKLYWPLSIPDLFLGSEILPMEYIQEEGERNLNYSKLFFHKFLNLLKSIFEITLLILNKLSVFCHYH